jgi:2-phospho-L-lactate guanylyltransferase (CobY/MobA/RfbA family)
MDERTSPPESSWPVPLHTVLRALREESEVDLDLGEDGVLHVRWTPASAPRERTVPSDLPALDLHTRHVLNLVAAGEPAAVVADELGVPIAEIAETLRALRERYGVDSTTAALESARRVGDLEAD